MGVKPLTKQQQANKQRLHDYDQRIRKAIAKELVNDSDGKLDHKQFEKIAWEQAWFATENLKDKSTANREAYKKSLVDWGTKGLSGGKIVKGYKGKDVAEVIREDAIRLAKTKKKGVDFKVALDSPEAIKNHKEKIEKIKSETFASFYEKKEFILDDFTNGGMKTSIVKIEKGGDKLKKEELVVAEVKLEDLSDKKIATLPWLELHDTTYRTDYEDGGLYDSPYAGKLFDTETGMPIAKDWDEFVDEFRAYYDKRKHAEKK